MGPKPIGQIIADELLDLFYSKRIGVLLSPTEFYELVKDHWFGA
jgi:hypothetical protein